LGIVKPDNGSIKLFGQDSNADSNKKIGVVMDSTMYIEDWTISDVAKAVAPFYSEWDYIKYEQYIQWFKLSPKKKVKELSRGMKVKLQIAVALSHNAQLLILDEPTSGLDPVARDEICDLLREFVEDENRSVFFSTHITSDLEKTADYITFIMDGEIVYTGTKDGIIEKYARVTGGVDDLDIQQREGVIGYREHSTGFEGMILTENSRHFPKNILCEPVTLDEIVIFISNGGVRHD
jgi:ABC-2 type transport system ATP-binding protein